MKPLPISVVQSRSRTPNYYLFRDLCLAINQSPLFELRDYGLLQDIRVKQRENLLIFGGEEIQDHKIGTLVHNSLRSYVWFTEDPYETERNVKFSSVFSKILTTDELSVKRYGNHATFMPLGTNISNKNYAAKKYDFDVIMFGSLWPNRLEILEKLKDNPLTQKLRILLITSQTRAKWVNQNIYRDISNWIQSNKGEVVEIFRPFSQSQLSTFISMAKICLNWPRSFGKDLWSVPGPRIIEVAAIPKVQLLDVAAQPGIHSILNSDSYLAYGAENICVKLAEAVNESDQKLSEIAKRGRDKVIAEFTWSRILSRLDQVMRAI
jgi:hypothetical protein